MGVDLEPAVPVDANACRAVREILEGEGVSIGQVWSVGTPLVRPDRGESAAHLQVLRDRVPLAAALGCRVLLTEAGGMHADSPWYPHPENHGEESLDRLIAALKEIAPFAADHGVSVAPEMSLMTILSTVDRTEALMAETDHPGAGVNFDPANILDPLSLYDSGAFVDDAFDRLGGPNRERPRQGRGGPGRAADRTPRGAARGAGRAGLRPPAAPRIGPAGMDVRGR